MFNKKHAQHYLKIKVLDFIEENKTYMVMLPSTSTMNVNLNVVLCSLVN
jgi:hypothetical protein